MCLLYSQFHFKDSLAKPFLLKFNGEGLLTK